MSQTTNNHRAETLNLTKCIKKFQAQIFSIIPERKQQQTSESQLFYHIHFIQYPSAQLTAKCKGPFETAALLTLQ